MSVPREGSRTIREGIIVSEPMDWCKSPSAIVPYKIYTHCQVEGANTADSVRQTDERSHVKGSLIRTCYGDEPGVGGGMKSGTHNAECTPKTWSSSVRFEDRNAVRHDDAWWMNHKNTWGRLTYIKDPKDYETPEQKQIEPKMQWASLNTNQPSASSNSSTNAVVQQARLMPNFGRAMPRRPPAPPPTTLDRPAPRDRIDPKDKPGPREDYPPIPPVPPGEIRVSGGGCCIDTYSYNKSRGCADCNPNKKTAAHHGMIDYPFRTGTRGNPGHTTPGAPSLEQARTICVPTEKGADGSDSEHTELHRNMRQAIKNATRSNETILFSDVKRISFDEIDKLPDDTLSKRCKEEYKKELEGQYRVQSDTPLRALESPTPKAGSAAGETLSRAWGFTW